MMSWCDEYTCSSESYDCGSVPFALLLSLGLVRRALELLRVNPLLLPVLQRDRAVGQRALAPRERNPRL